MKTPMMMVAVMLAAGLACGVQPPAEKPPQNPAPPTPAQPATPPTMPSLDDALGLSKPSDKPKDPSAQPAVTKPALPSALDRALKGEEDGNELQRAVALMDQSAKRLEGSDGTSLETQRMQEETVRLLDTLVKKGNKKNKPQSKPQGKPQDGEKKPEQQPSQSQQSQDQREKDDGKTTGGEVKHGGNTNAQLRPGIDAARAAWGNLPQRVRQLLMQGSGDQFSKEYQRLTEEYYKRLGEGGAN